MADEDPKALARELGVPEDAPALALLAAAATGRKKLSYPLANRLAKYMTFVDALAAVLEVDATALVEMNVRDVLQRLRHKVVEG
jgi:hypothetical protein